MFMETRELKGSREARATPPLSGLGYGRFMQADPAGYEDGPNLYSYAGGDPLNHQDSTGMWAEPGWLNQLREEASEASEQTRSALENAYLQLHVAEEEVRLSLEQSGGALEQLGDAAADTIDALVPNFIYRTGDPQSDLSQLEDRYSAEVRQKLTLSDRQLQSSAESHQRTVEQHMRWLRNPETKIPNFNELRVQHRVNIVHHWGQDISRNRAFRDIAITILRIRSQ